MTYSRKYKTLDEFEKDKPNLSLLVTYVCYIQETDEIIFFIGGSSTPSEPEPPAEDIPEKTPEQEKPVEKPSENNEKPSENTQKPDKNDSVFQPSTSILEINNWKDYWNHQAICYAKSQKIKLLEKRLWNNQQAMVKLREERNQWQRWATEKPNYNLPFNGNYGH